MPVIASVFSGLLLALSLPPYNQAYLAWFALVPLLLAARHRRPLEALGLGLVVGLTAGVFHARWSSSSSLVFAYLPFLWFAVLSGVVALAYGRFSASEAVSPSLRVLSIASVGIVAEWATTLTPLPVNFAVTQHNMLPVIQIADVTGIWGVSFGLWLANVALAEVIALRRRGGQFNWKPLAVAAAWLLVSLVYGVYKLGMPTQGRSLRVAAIQDFDPLEVSDIIDSNISAVHPQTRDELTIEAVRQGAQLVVWSEEALGTDFQERNPQDATRQLARKLRVHLVPGYQFSATGADYNMAALLDNNGRVLGTHRKIHLYAAERQTITAGESATPVRSEIGVIGLAICFDTCWTDVLRELRRDGAQLIAMPNFDPPVPGGVVHNLHGAMLPFRAVENRLPIVRADPNGQSQVIDRNGSVLATAPFWASQAVLATVNLSEPPLPLFVTYGEWFCYLTVVVLLFGFWHLRTYRKNSLLPPDNV